MERLSKDGLMKVTEAAPDPGVAPCSIGRRKRNRALCDLAIGDKLGGHDLFEIKIIASAIPITGTDMSRYSR
ncbi:hypothetical protein G6N76_16760 [Rhizobium daejeonense]|uniref:Uncharacterized protein n=1 Tax=Rhizobium daejeonense TaxID=240521 RepID=A0A6M1RUE0_9HYPH|nr:hypothetical protein [Rhizobium daejeonense]NGO65324.1 hypothetical protein [Rhizobium daejeonense]